LLDRLPDGIYVPERPDIVSGGDLVVIANCPTCGTQYKHPPPATRVRARCVRCDTTLFLARLRPYRIVEVGGPFPEEAARATSRLPIGFGHPTPATSIALNIARNASTMWPTQPQAARDEEDPLPQIREMAKSGAFESSVPSAEADDILSDGAREAFGRKTGDEAPDAESPTGGSAATFALWMATGAIAGTGASWTLGGTTMSGIAAGAALGAVTGWGWRRWTSPK
jgi:hypothetical protein